MCDVHTDGRTPRRKVRNSFSEQSNSISEHLLCLACLKTSLPELAYTASLLP